MVILGQPRDDHDYLARCLLSFKQQGVAGVIYLDADTTSNALPAALQACPLPLVAVSQTPLSGHHDRWSAIIARGRQYRRPLFD